ncbi:MAG: hypothetical protein IKX00_05185 [Bacilli bacterium]|nr:hypothetical protein [Bacilli bacterium]
MGIFGPIDDNKAIEIIKENIDRVIADTNEALEDVSRYKTSINGTPGIEIMWNIIGKATEEIPSYIIKDGLNIPADYPYGDPYVYVSCAIISKYVHATKEDKKMLSNGIQKFKKDGLLGLIQDIVKVYCDNIEKSLIRPKPYDKQKENAIRVLAANFEFYNKIFPDRTQDNGTSRTRK